MVTDINFWIYMFLSSLCLLLLLFLPFSIPYCINKVKHSGLPTLHYDARKDSEQGLATLPEATDGPWKEDGLGLKSCWATPTLG